PSPRARSVSCSASAVKTWPRCSTHLDRSPPAGDTPGPLSGGAERRRPLAPSPARRAALPPATFARRLVRGAAIASRAHEREQPIRADRKLADVDTERRQCIGDGIGDCSRRANRTALADTLEATERRGRRLLDMVNLHWSHLPR